MKSHGRIDDPAEQLLSMLVVGSQAEPMQDVVARQGPRLRHLGDELPGDAECFERQARP